MGREVSGATCFSTSMYRSILTISPVIYTRCSRAYSQCSCVCFDLVNRLPLRSHMILPASYTVSCAYTPCSWSVSSRMIRVTCFVHYTRTCTHWYFILRGLATFLPQRIALPFSFACVMGSVAHCIAASPAQHMDFPVSATLAASISARWTRNGFPSSPRKGIFPSSSR